MRSLHLHTYICNARNDLNVYIFAFLSSSKLKENLTELHIIVRTTGFLYITTNLELMTAPPQHESGRRRATIQGYSPGSASWPPTMVGTSPAWRPRFIPHLAHTARRGYLWDLQMWSHGTYKLPILSGYPFIYFTVHH